MLWELLWFIMGPGGLGFGATMMFLVGIGADLYPVVMELIGRKYNYTKRARRLTSASAYLLCTSYTVAFCAWNIYRIISGEGMIFNLFQ